MIGLVVFLVGVVVMTALACAGFERLFNHVEDPAARRRDETAPDPTAPGNGKRGEP